MDRGSSKHGPRLDEQMAYEVRGQTQGAGAGSRAEEWHEPEPVPEDEAGFDEAPVVDGREDAESAVTLDAPEREARSRLGRYLHRSVFPADRATLLAAARDAQAPDDVLGELERLAPDTRFGTVEEVWMALGHPPDQRF
jgi:hypothetical protein